MLQKPSNRYDTTTATGILAVLYDGYVASRKAGHTDNRSRVRALTRNQLENIAKVLNRPSPYSTTGQTNA